jgi:phospholipase D1/2
VPGFAGDIKADSSITTIMAAQFRTINRGGHSIYEELRKEGIEPCVLVAVELELTC